MGGKSTLLRATCVAVIMAQLGCYVPAESCVLSPVDAVYTRLGAKDRIMAGESTFFVECNETSSILARASPDSLIVLDELGRGTSTFDGYAIAYAVLKHLVDTIDCRLLFATHYHPLTANMAAEEKVGLYHMACLVRGSSAEMKADDVDDDVAGHDDEADELVFLYKLKEGACPKSYGLQVATLAGVPVPIVRRGAVAAHKMEEHLRPIFDGAIYKNDVPLVHQNWLRTIVSLQSSNEMEAMEDDDDTTMCVWYEIKHSAI